LLTRISLMLALGSDVTDPSGFMNCQDSPSELAAHVIHWVLATGSPTGTRAKYLRPATVAVFVLAIAAPLPKKAGGHVSGGHVVGGYAKTGVWFNT
jgi:hypothetical protein